MPPLALAIEQMRLEIAPRLIQAGADVNRRLEGGGTLLMHAIDMEADSASQRGKPPDQATTEFTELLLKAGAIPTVEAYELARRYGNHKAEAIMVRHDGGRHITN